jgi:hypothetical protein
MADNPFDPKYSTLLGMLGSPAPKTGNALSEFLSTTPARRNPFTNTLLGDAASPPKSIADLLYPTSPPPPALSGLGVASGSLAPSPLGFGALSGLFDKPPFPPPANPKLGAFSDLFPSGRPVSQFGALAPPPPKLTAPAVRRKAFFSFHYDDIMRVNVVRNAWKITHPDNGLMRSFQDSSLWESRKLEGDDAVKRLIREGVEYTSAVCVLIGTDTWVRRWVRFEIARAIIDGRGLLGVHLNSIRHHYTKTPHTRGYNPLDFMAVGKVQADISTPARYYLFEKQALPGGYRWAWNRYGDYSSSVTLPSWLADPIAGYVTPLSQNASVYDYIADDGHRNIGSWIDKAAQGAGR